ncbi:hypothetical protein FUT69_04265 [Xylella taiwanensis]|uniref:Uncharacterized protein n=1 Tax=Xylella taiwanensis TaxID=1444770 RepID=Z9JF91_9GAMM|nr:DUF6127 family protein [Xylella taiwanensis]AXI84392.1 hypothetical protein AB672_10855 [Xylella taiwanensis]EWS77025.1 hypothetical protein AF72_12925 [Xylella taiwanensis]NBI36431.1 hypothetical protein [Xylella taiwanensis]QKD99271.1 hypothetical protein PLS229_10885 [Xylella taiwanensis]
MLLLRREDCDALCTCTAERGAGRCLAHLDLGNDRAAHDIHGLHHLLEAWRHGHLTVWQSIITIAALLAGTASNATRIGAAQ